MFIEKEYYEKTYCSNFSALINSIKPFEETEVYVDGSFNDKLKKFAFAFMIVKGGSILYTECGTSNNSEVINCGSIGAELLACMKALEFAYKHNLKNIKLYYDYVGVYDFYISRNKKIHYAAYYYDTVVKYKDIINVNFTKVKGHGSGVVHHKTVDELARNTLKKIL